jgi:16S rRNA (uracil1498-N3)-methyltransferase
MNLVLLFEEDFDPGRRHVRLTGRRLEHVLEIHRAKTGDTLCVGMANGEVGRGRITRLDSGMLEMEVALDAAPPPPLPVTLVLALPRPLVLRRVLVSASSMGVKRIVLLNASAVEKSYWQSTAAGEADIRERLVLGLEQARDTTLPVVERRPRFRPFVEDELPALVAGAHAFVAHPGPVVDGPRGIEGDVVLAVGPENGWSDHELARLADAGLQRLSLGTRSLRVETAIPALLSRFF